MIPTLIGYFPKKTEKDPKRLADMGLAAVGVVEVCSVGNCICEAPAGWIQHWRHNALWLFNSEADAASVIPPDEPKDGYDMYAYLLHPTVHPAKHPLPSWKDRPKSPAGPPATPAPLTDDYELLGYDCVGATRGIEAHGFEHSPLSCNGMAEEIAVNRHCLIDDLAAAEATAHDFANGDVEPGDYYVVEVWRKRKA